MDANDRIKLLRSHLNYKQGEFAEILHIQQGSYSDVERKRTGVSRRIIATLEEKFNVNAEWVRTGHGDMFMPHTPHMSDRLKDIMNHYALNYYEFADKLKLEDAEKTTFISNVHENKEISLDLVNIICKAFPDVNRKYILSGTGNLLSKGRVTAITKDSGDKAVLLETIELYKKLNKSYEEQLAFYKDKIDRIENP